MLKNSPFHYSIATRIRNSFIKKHLSPKPNNKILDVGCGAGYYSKLILESKANIYGVDISPESIAICIENIGPNFSVGNAELLDYPDNTFDKVLCSEVLEHLKDDEKALNEIFRVLKPRGVLLVTVPCTEGFFGTKIKNIMHDHDDGPEKHEREGYTLKEISNLIENSGFIIEKTNYTMVFFTELIMGLTKKVYGIKMKEDHLDSQADVYQIKSSKLFAIYKIFFPLLLIIGKIDDLLFSRILKGHMVVVKATKKIIG